MFWIRRHESDMALSLGYLHVHVHVGARPLQLLCLTLYSQETPKRVTGKQYRMRRLIRASTVCKLAIFL